MKKKSISYKKIALTVRLLSIIILVGIMFIPLGIGLKMVVPSSVGDVITTYKTAYTFIFGGKLISEHINYQTITTSTQGLIAFIFFITSILFLIISFFVKKKISFFMPLFSTLFILIASVLMLSIKQSASNVLADAIVGEISESVRTTINKNTHLQFGFIGIGVLGLLTDLFLIISLFFDGSFDKIRTAIINKQNEK